MAKKKNWTVPLIEGTTIPWTEIWDAASNVKLDECEPDDFKFDATIKFIGIRKGYGSGTKVFVEDRDRTYTNSHGENHQVEYGIFLTDSYDIIMKMNEGIMSGTFTVCKRGQDYGIKLIRE